jgi:hypothetical protein
VRSGITNASREMPRASVISKIRSISLSAIGFIQLRSPPVIFWFEQGIAVLPLQAQVATV